MARILGGQDPSIHVDARVHVWYVYVGKQLCVYLLELPRPLTVSSSPRVYFVKHPRYRDPFILDDKIISRRAGCLAITRLQEIVFAYRQYRRVPSQTSFGEESPFSLSLSISFS